MADLFRFGEHARVQSVAEVASTLGDVLVKRAAASPTLPAHFEKVSGRWQGISWAEFYEQARRAAHGLVELGVGVGERVAILGPTSTTWARYELGSQLIGAVTVGIYPHQSSSQVRYLLEHSESKVIFVAGEEELATVLESAAAGLGALKIVPWESELAERCADDRIVPPARFEAAALAEEEIGRRFSAIDPDDTAMLVYTSGTTGPPKGAMLTHANLLSLLRHHRSIIEFFQDDLLFAFLPMAHASERNLSFYLRIGNGVAAAYASSIGAVLEELREVRPTVFGSVPRLFEKAHAKVLSDVAAKPKAVHRLFAWADSVGRQYVRRRLTAQPIGARLEVQYRLASLLVFRKIRAAFGGRVRAMITGAAPTSPKILEFFWAAGLPIFEAYGMTEATALTHINHPGAVKLGTVGRPAVAMECKTADDGEVLLRGPLVFKGYAKDPEATAETIVDGWLHSGDIGDIDGEGFLRITDRKKHLIITAGGKNLAPANIEAAIKSQDPLISHVHAHGDRRPYVTALIVPSPIETLEWGVGQGLLEHHEVEELRAELLADPAVRSPALDAAMARVVARPEFQQLFVEPVRAGNRQLTRVEQVRRFAVLDRDFSQQGGELTATMKVRREAVESKYSGLFARLYEDQDFGLQAESKNPGRR